MENRDRARYTIIIYVNGSTLFMFKKGNINYKRIKLCIHNAS